MRRTCHRGDGAAASMEKGMRKRRLARCCASRAGDFLQSPLLAKMPESLLLSLYADHGPAG